MASFVLKTDGTFLERPLKTLEDFQWAVGGNIELIPLTCDLAVDDEDYDTDEEKTPTNIECYCNENGRTLNLPVNPWTEFITREGFFCWRMIRGDIAIVGSRELKARILGFKSSDK